MKSELAPKQSQKIGKNYVLWFETTNSYVVMTVTAYQLLNCYFESKTKESFIQHLEQQLDIPTQQANAYHTDLLSFLNDINATSDAIDEHPVPESIPNADISNYYAFDDARICINFSSEKLQQLIHPYLQHAAVQNSSEPDTTFDIFEEKERLHLFKNNLFIGSYKTAKFHFLQGKFDMELVTAIYNIPESDWLATFHASTVCNDKEAIMIIGDSGNGKSTLSALLMAHGFDLLADDFTPMLAENQHLYRFPAAISIKKGAFEIMETLFADFASITPEINSSKQLTVKYLPPSAPFGSSKKHFECTKVVMVNYSPDGDSELKECASEKMLQTLIPDAWISSNAKHSRKFLNWLQGLKFYELSYSNNEVAVAKVKELFAR